MEQIIESLGFAVYTRGKHKGYIITYSLISPLCRKWSRNRDCDMVRVDEMVNYYREGGYIPPFIHLAEVAGEGLVCYDGNHRREAFKQITEDIICVIDIIFNATQQEVYDAFDVINKSVQLPAIYLDYKDEETLRIKDEIISIVKSFEVKYKKLVSASSRCYRPHFNRDVFIENIDTIYKSFGGRMTPSEIGILLEKLNVEYSKQNFCLPHSHYKSTIIEKCRKTGLWLFLERTIPFEHVEKLMTLDKK